MQSIGLTDVHGRHDFVWHNARPLQQHRKAFHTSHPFHQLHRGVNNAFQATQYSTQSTHTEQLFPTEVESLPTSSTQLLESPNGPLIRSPPTELFNYLKEAFGNALRSNNKNAISQLWKTIRDETAETEHDAFSILTIKDVNDAVKVLMSNEKGTDTINPNHTHEALNMLQTLLTTTPAPLPSETEYHFRMTVRILRLMEEVNSGSDEAEAEGISQLTDTSLTQIVEYCLGRFQESLSSSKTPPGRGRHAKLSLETCVEVFRAEAIISSRNHQSSEIDGHGGNTLSTTIFQKLTSGNLASPFRVSLGRVYAYVEEGLVEDSAKMLAGTDWEGIFNPVDSSTKRDLRILGTTFRQVFEQVENSENKVLVEKLTRVDQVIRSLDMTNVGVFGGRKGMNVSLITTTTDEVATVHQQIIHAIKVLRDPHAADNLIKPLESEGLPIPRKIWILLMCGFVDIGEPRLAQNVIRRAEAHVINRGIVCQQQVHSLTRRNSLTRRRRGKKKNSKGGIKEAQTKNLIDIGLYSILIRRLLKLKRTHDGVEVMKGLFKRLDRNGKLDDSGVGHRWNELVKLAVGVADGCLRLENFALFDEIVGTWRRVDDGGGGQRYHDVWDCLEMKRLIMTGDVPNALKVFGKVRGRIVQKLRGGKGEGEDEDAKQINGWHKAVFARTITVAYGTLISGLAQRGLAREAERVLRAWVQDCTSSSSPLVELGMEPDVASVTPVVEVYCREVEVGKALDIVRGWVGMFSHDGNWIDSNMDAHLFAVLFSGYRKREALIRYWREVRGRGNIPGPYVDKATRASDLKRREVQIFEGQVSTVDTAREDDDDAATKLRELLLWHGAILPLVHSGIILHHVRLGEVRLVETALARAMSEGVDVKIGILRMVKDLYQRFKEEEGVKWVGMEIKRRSGALTGIGDDGSQRVVGKRGEGNSGDARGALAEDDSEFADSLLGELLNEFDDGVGGFVSDMTSSSEQVAEEGGKKKYVREPFKLKDEGYAGGLRITKRIFRGVKPWMASKERDGRY
ncbi:hypothetical protein HDU76_006623 [Blyttiomyces sp. JEL0837]|nr:hypothetical protein HDU76_006623 [Blyttiomyces sp. JEL0837]